MKTNYKWHNWSDPLSTVPAPAENHCYLPLKLHALAQFLASVAASTGNTFHSEYVGQPTDQCQKGRQQAETHCSLIFAQDPPASWGHLQKMGLLLRQQLKALFPTGSTVQIHSFYRSSELAWQRQAIESQSAAGYPHLELLLIHLPVELLPEEALSLVARSWRHLAQQRPVKANSSCIWLGPPLALLILHKQLAELWGQPGPGQMAFCLPCAELPKILSATSPEFAQDSARKLLPILGSSHLGYLLKGWFRPELKAKGLLRHPAFGLLADWAVEDIQNLCCHWNRDRPQT